MKVPLSLNHEITALGADGINTFQQSLAIRTPLLGSTA
jgi:hypothetical protein